MDFQSLLQQGFVHSEVVSHFLQFLAHFVQFLCSAVFHQIFHTFCSHLPTVGLEVYKDRLPFHSPSPRAFPRSSLSIWRLSGTFASTRHLIMTRTGRCGAGGGVLLSAVEKKKKSSFCFLTKKKEKTPRTDLGNSTIEPLPDFPLVGQSSAPPSLWFVPKTQNRTRYPERGVTPDLWEASPPPRCLDPPPQASQIPKRKSNRSLFVLEI